MTPAAHAAPWSPDGSWIAYSYIGNPENIYLVRADGSEPRTLLARNQRDFRPEWSPDGSHLVFTSVVEGKHVMVQLDLEGRHTRLSEPEEVAGDPEYSPDGKQLLYFTDEPLPRELYLRELATGETRQLTDTPEFDEYSARWAPDGRRVAFVGKTQEENATGDIWILDIENGRRQNATRSPETDEFHPAWSHDGNKLVYIQVRDGDFSVVWRDLESGKEQLLAGGNGYAVLSPHFSPNDEWVSFTRTDFAEKAEKLPAIVKVRLRDGQETVITRWK
jgi:Tol biopolymer transport system component